MWKWGNGYRCFKDTKFKYKMNESGGRHSMVILVNDTVVAFL